jgi:hypothetical protein
MAKEIKKKVRVEYRRGFITEINEDIAQKYESRGRLKILGPASASSKAPAPAKESDAGKGSDAGSKGPGK